MTPDQNEFQASELQRLKETNQKLLDEIENYKRVEEELRENKAILRSFFDLSSEFMIISELDGNQVRVISANQAVVKFLGLPKEEINGKFLSEIGIPSEVQALWVSKYNQCIKAQKDVSFEYQRTFKEGTTTYLLAMVTLIGVSKVGLPRFSYIVKDITEMKEKELALLASEERFNLAEEFSRSGSWEYSFNGNQMRWSPALKKLFGLNPDFKPNRESFLALVHPDDRHVLMESIEKTRTVGTHQVEFRVVLPDDSIRWIEGKGQGVFDENNDCTKIIGISYDITDRKVVEQKLFDQSSMMVHLSKTSALGEMASGMAHEINNPMTVIKGNAVLIKKLLSSDKFNLEKVKQIAETVEATSARVAEIIDGLRTFARDGSTDHFEKANLNQIILQTLALCSERFKSHGIELEVPDLTQQVWILCRPVQISQVLLNLLNNAYDAVELAVVKKVKIEITDTGQNIVVRIIDSGCGLFRPTYSVTVSEV